METDKSLLLGEEISHISNRNRTKAVEYGRAALFKGHLQILIGFVLGFFMAFAMLLFYERIDQQKWHFTSTEYYQIGYSKKSLEELETSEGRSLQQLLVEDVRVLCMVLTCPKYHQSKAAHVRATWGRRCSKLIFVSSEVDTELGAVEVVAKNADNYKHLWNKTREGFRHVFEQYYEDYDWFLKADDDTYVVMENLRYMLYGYYPETPIYFGHQLVFNNVSYMSGGAAYILSKEALRRFMTDSYHNDSICSAADQTGAEDFYMGVCLQNVDVHLADSRIATAADNKPKFFPLSLLAYMEPQWNTTIPEWLIEMTPQSFEMGLECCSNYSIAFHYVEPAGMYTYEYLIYHLQAFGLTNRRTDKLPDKISTKEVMRIFPNNNSLLEGELWFS